jgi:DNA-binding winged helix-turn-helix (wHTH) protein/Flp pilus assembly protein TadD
VDYQFSTYRFDPARGLSCDGRAIHLPPKERRLLQALLEAEGRFVSKEALIARVWDGKEVSDASIFRAMYRLRRAMPAQNGDDVLATVYRTGVRLAVPVRVTSRPRGIAATGIGGTRRTEAAESLLAAREHFGRRSPADLDAAIGALWHALDVDPDYVAAWVALAETHAMQAMRSLRDPREAGRLAREAADQAIARDPDSAPAHAIRGWVRAVIDLDFAAGLVEVERGVELDDAYWATHALRAWVLAALRRHDEAVDAMRQALELNPVGRAVNAMLAWYLLFAGRADEALQAARELVQRFSAVDTANQIAAIMTSLHRRHEEAIAFGRRAAELGPDTPMMRTGLAYALANAGRAGEARAVLRSIYASPLPRPSWALAPVHLALGEQGAAVDLIVDACERRSPFFVWTRDDPRLAELHGEPAVERAWSAIDTERGDP